MEASGEWCLLHIVHINNDNNININNDDGNIIFSGVSLTRQFKVLYIEEIQIIKRNQNN